MDRCRTSWTIAVGAMSMILATSFAQNLPYPAAHSGSQHCNCLRWTNWINADTPSDSGDWETLGPPDERGRPGTIHHVRPDICTVPVRMECRTVDGHTPWYLNKQKISYECNAQGKGFACLHKKQPSYKSGDSDSSYDDKSGGYKCHDYEARVLCFYAGGGYDECPCLYWTKWYNTDNPAKGEGDEELIGYTIPKYVCEGNYEPVDVQCKTVAGHDVFHAGNRNVRCDLRGLTCYNGEQGKNCKCHDYEVRFLCPRFASNYPVRAYGTGYEKSKGGYESYSGSKYESADKYVKEDDLVIAGDYSKALSTSDGYKEVGTVHGKGIPTGYESELDEFPVPGYGGGGGGTSFGDVRPGFKSEIGSESKYGGEEGGYVKEEFGGGAGIKEAGQAGYYEGGGAAESKFEAGNYETGSHGHGSAYEGGGGGHGSVYEGGGGHRSHGYGGSEYEGRQEYGGGDGGYEDDSRHHGGSSKYEEKKYYSGGDGSKYGGSDSRYGTSKSEYHTSGSHRGGGGGSGYEAGYGKGGHGEYGEENLVVTGDYSKGGGGGYDYEKEGGYEDGYGSNVEDYERPIYNTGEDDGYGYGGGALVGPLDVDYSDGGAYSEGEYYESAKGGGHYEDKDSEYKKKEYDTYGKGGGDESGHYESSSDYRVGGIRMKQRYKEGIEASSVNYKADYALEAKKAYGGEHGEAAVDEAEYHTNYGGHHQADEGSSSISSSSSDIKSDASYGLQDLTTYDTPESRTEVDLY